MSDSEEELLLFILLEKNVLLDRCHRKKKWVHQFNEDRSAGEFAKIHNSLMENPDKFKEYYRMTPESFNYILEGIKDDLTVQSNFRKCISPEEKLSITIRYLATGMSFRSLALTFRLNDFTVGICVSSVVDAIWKNFHQTHLAVPDRKRFEEIATGFEERWNFIHAIGCIDGKHIRIKCPKQSGTMYYNYKNFFSIILQAVADYRCRFVFVDVGGYGKQSDGGTFTASTLSTFLEKCNSALPVPSPVEGIDHDMPFVILGDDAYPLKNYLMKPYSKRCLSQEEKVFNYRLSRARRCVECAFGIITSKWRLLGKCIETDVNKAEQIVKCICLLHNLLIDREGSEFFSSAKLKDISVETPPPQQCSTRSFNRSSQQAQNIRDTFKSYFNGIGSVPWQNDRIQ